MCGLVESGGKSVVFVTCYTQYQFLVVGETIGLTLNLSDPKPKVGRAVARSSAPSEAAEIAKLTKAARAEAIRESVPADLRSANYFERHPSRTGKGKQQFAA